MRDKIAKFVTGSMLGYITFLVIVIILAIMLNYAEVIDLSDAYNWF